MKKIPKISQQKSPMMRYILIITLVILLGFAILYVYHIQKEVSEKFEEKSDKGKYIVTYVYKEGCFYCKKFKPVWDEWKSTNATRFVANEFEQGTQQGQAFVRKYNITGFPTMIVENSSGNIVDTKVGYCDIRTFTAFVDSNTTFVA